MFRSCLSRPAAAHANSKPSHNFTNDTPARSATPAGGDEKLATAPFGPLPPDTDPAECRLMTVVGNVLLNLDETVLKR